MANTKRLIDAYDFYKKFANDTPTITVGAQRYVATWRISDLIADAPTVDAVDAREYYSIVSKLEGLLCHATGNQYSKAGYSLESMMRMVTDYIEECCEEAVNDAAVHGQWIEYNTFMTCSECDTDWFYEDNDCDRLKYCPNCGAKMDGDGNG